LAHRAVQRTGPIYHYLGHSTASIIHDQSFQFDPPFITKDYRLLHLRPIERRTAYRADITYGTNNEFGFDYLRDNMKFSLDEYVQRELHYGIVDEVDNILIDEARTPLIISGPAEESTDKYYVVDRIIPRLRKDTDYTIDEKHRSAMLTEEGIAKCERLLGVSNLYDPSQAMCDRDGRFQEGPQARRGGHAAQQAQAPRRPPRRGLQERAREIRRRGRGDQGVPRQRAAGPGRHHLGREVRARLEAAQEGRRQAQRAERHQPRGRGQHHRPGR